MRQKLLVDPTIMSNNEMSEQNGCLQKSESTTDLPSEIAPVKLVLDLQDAKIKASKDLHLSQIQPSGDLHNSPFNTQSTNHESQSDCESIHSNNSSTCGQFNSDTFGISTISSTSSATASLALQAKKLKDHQDRMRFLDEQSEMIKK
jgi:hypothetical protein